MSPVRAVRSCLRQYAEFSGRAPRSQFWWWCVFWLLACELVQLVAYLPFGEIPDSVIFPPNVPFIVFFVAGFLPSLSVTVRRLHDADWSGWWAALLMLPCVYVVWPEALGGDIGTDRAIGFIVFDFVIVAAYLFLGCSTVHLRDPGDEPFRLRPPAFGSHRGRCRVLGHAHLSRTVLDATAIGADACEPLARVWA